MKMDKEEFWESSPRKIYSLIIEFANMNKVEDKKEKPNKIYADDFEKFLTGSR